MGLKICQKLSPAPIDANMLLIPSFLMLVEYNMSELKLTGYTIILTCSNINF